MSRLQAVIWKGVVGAEVARISGEYLASEQQLYTCYTAIYMRRFRNRIKSDTRLDCVVRYTAAAEETRLETNETEYSQNIIFSSAWRSSPATLQASCSMERSEVSRMDEDLNSFEHDLLIFEMQRSPHWKHAAEASRKCPEIDNRDCKFLCQTL
jgi:hypothetical protein